MIQLAYASFLGALWLLLIPVIIHLIKRRPSTPRDFPSFFFLGASAVRSHNKNTLWKLLVLLLRMLTIAAICLAFAWPFMSDVAPEIKAARVLLWDRSFSMQASPFSRKLVKMAEEVINTTGPDTPLLIGMAGESVIWSGKFSGDRDKLMRWFRKNCHGPYTSSFQLPIKQAEVRLRNIKCKNKKIILISDRQLLPWENIDFNRPLEPGIGLEFMSPADKNIKNCAVVEVGNASVYSRAGQLLKVNAVIKNFGKTQLSGSADAELSGYTGVNKFFNLEAGKSIQLEFNLKPDGKSINTTGPPHALAGNVTINCLDDINIDNVRYFHINPPAAVGQVRVSPLTKGETDFIAMAFMPEITQENYRKMLYDGAKSAGLGGASLLILRAFRLIDEKYQAQVRSYLNDGGNVVVIADRSRECAGMLEEYGVYAKNQKSEKVYLNLIDYEHPVFNPYTKIKSEGWFSIAFNRWMELNEPPDAMVLARFSGGQPAIIELNRGKGKLFIVAAGVDRNSSDWSTNATFLPFWRELLAYVNSLGEKRGEKTDFESSDTALNLPSKAQVMDCNGKIISEQGSGFVPNIPGNYRIKNAEASSMISVNAPAAESDCTMIAQNFDTNLARLSVNAAKPPVNPGKSEWERLAAVNHPDNRNWWRSLLVAALIMMTLEMLIANRAAL